MTRCPHCGRALMVSDHVPSSAKRACVLAVEGTEIDWWTLLKPGRSRAVVRARWRAWAILRGLDYSFPGIARVFGVDHSTVQYGIRQNRKINA